MSGEFSEADSRWMKLALEYAQRAADAGEVPVAAVLVHNERLIAACHNSPISSQDVSAHAEINCLRAAGKHFQNYRLPPDCTLYVTLEPCTMCAGALIHSRVKRVVIAAMDEKTGAAGSVFTVLGTDRLNHHIDVETGLYMQQSVTLLQQFFRERRKS